jgi:hypothetical protein
MKYIKKFEKTMNPSSEEKNKEMEEIFREIYDENPLKDDNDFYLFIGRNDFKETKDGLYKKTLEIENMVRISPDDKQSIGAMWGLQIRAIFQNNSNLYHIWLPKELKEFIEGKGSNRIDEWLLDLIDKYKVKGSDEHGAKVKEDVIKRREDMKKYNL